MHWCRGHYEDLNALEPWTSGMFVLSITTNLSQFLFCMMQYFICVLRPKQIDRASHAEKSARKDEKSLFWPPPIIARSVTKSTGSKKHNNK